MASRRWPKIARRVATQMVLVVERRFDARLVMVGGC